MPIRKVWTSLRIRPQPPEHLVDVLSARLPPDRQVRAGERLAMWCRDLETVQRLSELFPSVNAGGLSIRSPQQPPR